MLTLSSFLAQITERPGARTPAGALLKGAGSTALDAIGLLPEGGAVSAAFSLFHGTAGISSGQRFLSGPNLGQHSSLLPMPGPMSQGRVGLIRLRVLKPSLASRRLGLVLRRLADAILPASFIAMFGDPTRPQLLIAFHAGLRPVVAAQLAYPYLNSPNSAESPTRMLVYLGRWGSTPDPVLAVRHPGRC